MLLPQSSAVSLLIFTSIVGQGPRGPLVGRCRFTPFRKLASPTQATSASPPSSFPGLASGGFPHLLESETVPYPCRSESSCAWCRRSPSNWDTPSYDAPTLPATRRRWSRRDSRSTRLENLYM